MSCSQICCCFLIGMAEAVAGVGKRGSLLDWGEENPAGEPTDVGTIKSSRFIVSI